mmetsp:Transcript_32812/g.93114  ORF Transcript_32812/g.93114 Transcript_32812/m.93114 type:complete len:258 (+) Transcript_32812:184-957(+)|eukprot:CAMPEP_0117668496 /NCGR_PEP_ID=MMETSP0804-20121206/11582_1 /TAXON_ID=1074897 /ORGANISM="Tetraselmis astigmatica, Strain CCMP880" /LENGTH=257 /DNA_ID=CAMNT_0005476395 /DNA_START=107 /DNA_END=880 /DNA_ORIENTATION=+
MGCGASKVGSDDAVIAPGGVKPLLAMKFDNTELSSVDVVFQSADRLNKQMEKLNDGLTKSVDNVIKSCGNPNSGLKDAITSTLSLLTPEAAKLVAKQVASAPALDKLLSSGTIVFEMPTGDAIVDALLGCPGVDKATAERVRAIMDMVPSIVSITNETLPAILQELTTLQEKAKTMGQDMSNPEKLKSMAIEAGLIGNNPMSDGMKVVNLAKTLKNNVQSCVDKLPKNSKIVADNITSTCTAVVDAFNASKADIKAQ